MKGNRPGAGPGGNCVCPSCGQSTHTCDDKPAHLLENEAAMHWIAAEPRPHEFGYGDTPHEDYAYADQIWMEIPPARFFMTSPVLELLDFLERLAPITSPELQARDPRPRHAKPQRNHG